MGRGTKQGSKDIKEYMRKILTQATLAVGEELYLYLAVSKATVSAVPVKEENKK